MSGTESELLDPARGYCMAVADLGTPPMLTDSAVPAPAARANHPLTGPLPPIASGRSRMPTQGELFSAVRIGTAESAGVLAWQAGFGQRTSARIDVWSAR